MEYIWNEKKNISNNKKHGVWFEEAQTVWSFEHALEFFDRDHSDSEKRYIRIGYSSLKRVLVIVFTESPNCNDIRIISARKATKRERIQYGKRI